ncbi:MAG TPA: hypothetical protein DCS48_03130 [Desulfovibrio sp.]|nr:hypothetical protein [Desulfovibrio sp.]
MNKDFVLRLVFGLMALVWPLVLTWNGYLHNSMQNNRDEVHGLRLELAQKYVTTDKMDKFIVRVERLLERLEERLDSK